MVSLISIAMMVSVSPAVKDIAVSMGRGEKRGVQFWKIILFANAEKYHSDHRYFLAKTFL